MSNNNGQNKAKVWREFWVMWSELFSDNIADAGGAPGQAFAKEPQKVENWQNYKVIEIDALNELKAENERLTKELATIDQANIIAERRLHGDSSDKMDASQEAAHYNWLDEQNEKLKKEVQRLKDKLHVEQLKDHEASAALKEAKLYLENKQLTEKLRVTENKLKLMCLIIDEFSEEHPNIDFFRPFKAKLHQLAKLGDGNE